MAIGRGALAAALAGLVAVGAVGGSWLVERALHQEATTALAAAGLAATVEFSGRDAVVTADADMVDAAADVVAGVFAVHRVEARGIAPSLSQTPSPSPTPTPTPTPSPTPTPTPTPEPMPEVVIHFRGAAPCFDETQQETVDVMAAWLVATPSARIEVRGHTDNGRTQSFREELSQLRAQCVVDALIAAGADPEQLEAVAMADREPVASNDTASGSAANRRVSFVAKSEG